MATVGNSGSKYPRPSKRLSPVAAKYLDKEPDAVERDLLAAPRPKRRRRGWFWMIGGGFFVLLLVALAAAPSIIGGTRLRDQVLNAALKLDGTVHTERGSAGWFSPIVVEGITIFDRDGKPVITADSFATEQTLSALALSTSKPGRITLVHPVVNLVMREKGSNVEDIFRPLMAGGSGKNTLEAVGVKISDGVVNILDTPSKNEFQLQQVEVDLAFDKRAKEPILLDASASMPTENDRATMAINIKGGTAEGGIDVGVMDCAIDQVPLELAAPFLRRKLAGAQMTGRAGVKAHGVWGEGDAKDSIAIDGNVRVKDFALACDALGRDELHLQTIDLPCRLTKRGNSVKIEQLALKTDLGQAAVEGTIGVAALTPGKDGNVDANALINSANEEGYRAEARLDLAALAAQLPNALNIRKGTELTDGTIEVVFTGEPSRDGIQWKGSLKADNLQAKADGRRIDLGKGVAVEFAAHPSDRGPVVDSATFESTFMQLEGKGTLDDFTANGTFDFQTLVAELDQFIDLKDVELAGNGRTQLRLQRDASDNFKLSADLNAENFALAMPGRRAWREPSVQVTLDANGRLDVSPSSVELRGLDDATFVVAAGQEKLTAKLLESVAKLSGATIPISLDWQGELEAWLPRLDPFMNTTGMTLAGAAAAKGQLLVMPDGIELRKGTFASEPFQYVGNGLFINERRFDAGGTLQWDRVANKLTIPTASIEADTLLAKITDAVVTMTNGTPGMMGTARFEGELAQLSKWFEDARNPSGRQMQGKLVGQAVVERVGRTTTAKLRSTIDQLLVAEATRRGQQAPQAWRERQLVVDATATYSDTDDKLKIESADITSDALRARVAGTIDQVSQQMELNLNGTIDYDWQTLAPFWRPYVGPEVQIVGQESRRFVLQGPLPQAGQSLSGMLKPLTAEGGLGWQKIEAFGLPIGQGEVLAKLDRGVLQVQPLDVPVSDRPLETGAAD